MFSTIGWKDLPGINALAYARLERLARDKHSSLCYVKATFSTFSTLSYVKATILLR